MSVFWKSDRFGYDGDNLHGDVTVNYWRDRAEVEKDLDRQLAEIRDQALTEYDRLMEQEKEER